MAQINEAVAAAASFDVMRRKEVSGEWKLKMHPNSAHKLAKADKKGKGPDELFGVMMRKGEVGGFNDELDAATILFVEARMADFLTLKLLTRYEGNIHGSVNLAVRGERELRVRPTRTTFRPAATIQIPG